MRELKRDLTDRTHYRQYWLRDRVDIEKEYVKFGMPMPIVGKCLTVSYDSISQGKCLFWVNPNNTLTWINMSFEV